MGAEPAGVPASHQSHPGGGALSHDVVVAEESSALGKLIHVWSIDLRVVVAYVSPTLVIGQDNDNIGLGSKKLSPDQEYWKEEKQVHGSLFFMVSYFLADDRSDGRGSKPAG